MEFDLNKKHCYYFKQISDIPRGSRNEKAISDYIVAFAKDHGYDCIQDEVYNVIVYKPASPGYEKSEPIILQAHTDMVCEKNKDVEHDFEKDPLELYVEDGLLKAKGTTLGADDGMGVAYMLAILDDPDLPHPALECAFTVMEEVGLLGAQALKKEYFHAKRYINLDAGGEVATSVTSSGGTRTTITKDLVYSDNADPTYCLKIRGLKGGHSAGVIHLERGNAILIAARIMEKLINANHDIRLADINGGMKNNAIPRECDVTFSTKTDYETLQRIVEEMNTSIKEELQYSDEGFNASLDQTDTVTKAIDEKQTETIFDFLSVIPNGLQHRSMAIEGLSIASLNCGVIHIEDNQLLIHHLLRSAISSHGDQMIEQLQILSKTFGFTYSQDNRYYGWNYSKDSELRNILASVLKDKGSDMVERSSHGGLECGIFKGMIPELDIITYGPITEGAHTPQENLDLASFDRSYENLIEVLKRAK